MIVCYRNLLLTALLALYPAAAYSQSAMLAASERRDAPKTVLLTVRLDKTEDWRTSEQGASQSVLAKAQDVLADWLRKQPPYVSFRPTVDFIERELLKEGVHTEMRDEVVLDGEKRRLYTATVNLHLTPSAQDKLRKEADRYADSLRAREAWHRQWPMFKVLLFIVAVAGAIGGYFHLDDRTQGYYSKSLRLAAIAAVALVGYGIVLLP